MKKQVNKLCIAYAAGTIGALANAAFIAVIAMMGINVIFDMVAFSSLSFGWLFPRMIWGGIFALFLLAPTLGKRWIVRGLLVSIVPTIIAIYAMPVLQGGMTEALKLEITLMILVITYLFNCVWGLVASYLYSELA